MSNLNRFGDETALYHYAYAVIFIQYCSSTDSPTAVISHNRSMPSQQLYLILDDGVPGLTITCSADGYLPPTVEWVKDNGGGLPHGILQHNIPSNGEVAVQLRWQREMDFTDSGFYVCRASNSNGTNTATLELLVQSKYACTMMHRNIF